MRSSVYGQSLVTTWFCSLQDFRRYLLVTRVIGALQVFDLVYMVMDISNPALKKTESIVYLFYQYSFQNGNKGYGSAIVVLLLAVIMVLTVFQMIGQKKWVHYN